MTRLHLLLEKRVADARELGGRATMGNKTSIPWSARLPRQYITRQHGYSEHNAPSLDS